MGHTEPGQGPVITEVAERRPGMAPLAATVLDVLVLALAAATLTLVSLVRQFTVHHLGPGILIVLIYAGVGVVIARRQPRNPIGWLLEPAHVSLWTRERGG